MSVSSVERPVSALRQRMLEDGAARSAIRYAAQFYQLCARFRCLPWTCAGYCDHRECSPVSGSSTRERSAGAHHQLLRVGLALLLHDDARPAGSFAASGAGATVEAPEPIDWRPSCPCCGGSMRIVETFERWMQPRAPPRASATGTPSCPARPKFTSRRDVPRFGDRHRRAVRTRRRIGLEPRTPADTYPPPARRKISIAASPSTPPPLRAGPHRPQAKAKIPIDLFRHTAGSCLGVFVRLTASENLHQSRSVPVTAAPLEGGR
jgi:hypothetical protein